MTRIFLFYHILHILGGAFCTDTERAGLLNFGQVFQVSKLCKTRKAISTNVHPCACKSIPYFFVITIRSTNTHTLGNIKPVGRASHRTVSFKSLVHSLLH